MSDTPAGWYPTDDGQQRYWDGSQWTEHFAPGAGDATAVSPSADPSPASDAPRVFGSGDQNATVAYGATGGPAAAGPAAGTPGAAPPASGPPAFGGQASPPQGFGAPAGAPGGPPPAYGAPPPGAPGGAPAKKGGAAKIIIPIGACLVLALLAVLAVAVLSGGDDDDQASTDTTEQADDPAPDEEDPTTTEGGDDPAPTTEGGDDPAPTTAAPSGDADGTLESPFPHGTTQTVGDYEVTFTVTLDATDAVQGANDFNDPPSNDAFALVSMDVTYVGSEEGTPGFDLSVVLQGGDGVQYTDTDCGATTPRPSFEVPTLTNGGSAQFDFCWDYPNVALDGGTAFVEPLFSFDGEDRVYWELQP